MPPLWNGREQERERERERERGQRSFLPLLSQPPPSQPRVQRELLLSNEYGYGYGFGESYTQTLSPGLSPSPRGGRGKGGGRYNEMFDPFSSVSRPRRKTYSPFEAFEARASVSSNASTGVLGEVDRDRGGERDLDGDKEREREREMIVHAFETVEGGFGEESHPYQYQQVVSESMHMDGYGYENEDPTPNAGDDGYRGTLGQTSIQTQGRRQLRKSGLSFEIGGDDDDIESDIERVPAASTSAHIDTEVVVLSHSHSRSRSGSGSGSYSQGRDLHQYGGREQLEDEFVDSGPIHDTVTVSAGRPSTGGSSASFEHSHGHGHGHGREAEQEQESHHPSSHEDSSASFSNNTSLSSVEQEDTEIDESTIALTPPRPPFIRDAGVLRSGSGAGTGEGEGTRGSWSSQDSTSLYPTSDTELVGTASDSDREGGRRSGRMTRRGHGGALRERAHSTGTRPGADRRRSPGSYSYSSMANVGGGGGGGGGGSFPPGAGPPAHGNVQVHVPPFPNLNVHTHRRRYSGGGGTRRRSASGSAIPVPVPTHASAQGQAQAQGLVQGEIEEVDRHTGETQPHPQQQQRAESPSILNAAAAAAASVPGGVGVVGQRTRGAAPPSAFRGSSRSSFSGVGVVPVPVAQGVPAEDAHPLSPNAADSLQEQQSANGDGGVGAGTAAGAYAHQYPHASPTYESGGYQYPPTPSPGSYPGYPGGGYAGYAGYGGGVGEYALPPGAYPYPPLPPSGAYPPPGLATPTTTNGAAPGPASGAIGAGAVNGVNSGSVVGPGYATPTPRAPPSHNAFIANSAMVRSSSAVDLVPYAAKFSGVAGGGVGSRRNSVDFAPPQPPFANSYHSHYSYNNLNNAASGYPPPPPSPVTPSAGTPVQEGQHHHNHQAATPRLREPFLSPASRRSSSVWVPPTPIVYAAGNLGYASGGGNGGESTVDGRSSGFYAYGYAGSNTALALPGKKEPLPSSALRRKISLSEKPWMKNRDKGDRAAWWLTFCIMWIGIAVGAVVIFFGFSNVQKLDGGLCSVLDEDFSTFNTDIWSKNVSLGGFGNGEFQMMTDSSDNLYVKNGQLYIMPTLTSDEIGTESIFDGYTYNLTGCTETWNRSACSATSRSATGNVVNPVKSARISTKESVSLRYGKVEIRAKMPRGDWLWPAIWMLPKDEKYGAWPRSGEIDIVESRGNPSSYPKQGNNYVRSSLNWGPLDNVLASAFGWQSLKRSSYASSFHTYTLEWSPKFIRLSVDTRLRSTLTLSNLDKKSFFERGGFPVTAQNGSTQAVVENIWANDGGGNDAPFDQEFYLILSLAVGGTSGWFEDGVGGKMWFDGSGSAMSDFAKAQDVWSATWPESDDDRAMRVDSVKMWKMC